MFLHEIQPIFGIIECIAVVVGAIVAIHQWLNQRKIQKISLLEESSKSLMKDSDIAAVIHKIEWDEKIGFEKDHFCDKETERIVDYTLASFSNFLVKLDLCKKDVFHFPSYVLKHILENEEIQSYLNFLLDVVQGNQNVHPYKQLLDYGKEKQFEGEIYEKK